MDGRGYLITLFLFLKGLAAIPVSLFFSPEHRKGFDKYVRFCFVKVIKHSSQWALSALTAWCHLHALLTTHSLFMKENSTLDAAADILKKWNDGQWN